MDLPIAEGLICLVKKAPPWGGRGRKSILSYIYVIHFWVTGIVSPEDIIFKITI